MKYQSKRNGQVAELVSEDKKYNTVMLEYPGGKTVSITTSTLKRWWKVVEEDTVDEAVQELATECPEIGQEELAEIKQASEDFASDGTPYTQVMQEIIEDHKQEVARFERDQKIHEECVKNGRNKAKAAPGSSRVKNQQERKNRFNEVKALLDSKGIVYLEYEKLPNLLVIRNGKKSVFEFRAIVGGATFNCREKDCLSGLEYRTVSNYYMPFVITVDRDSYEEVLDRMLSEVFPKYNR